MACAAIDIDEHVFQAAVFDSASGEVVEERFSADRQSLGRWAERWHGRVGSVAIEATTGWRWVWRELIERGFEVRLAEPVQARGLLGRRRSAKTDRLDARWLPRLLAREMLPESWIPPAEIQQLRDRTRLRKALAEDRRRWAQRGRVSVPVAGCEGREGAGRRPRRAQAPRARLRRARVRLPGGDRPSTSASARRRRSGAASCARSLRAA
jgi:Transposase